MANRVFHYADPDISAFIRRHFVPVVGDDWYQRRRQDAEGDFYQGVHRQAPHHTPEGHSRQGLYILTASGTLLSFTNTWKMDTFWRFLRAGVKNWEALPAAERAPGALVIPPLDVGQRDVKYTRVPPADGSILKVHTRVLDQAGNGFKACEAEGEKRWGLFAASDHMWLRKEELRGLEPGPLPEPFASRMLRFHMVDNTRGEPSMWKQTDIRSRDLRLVQVPGEAGRLRLEGSFLVHTDDRGRGFEASVLGYLDVDPATGTLTALKVVALGEHWGDGDYTPGARPGRTPLGVALHRVSGEDAADRTPPQAIRYVERYWKAEQAGIGKR
ncbi:MAG: hypothetical protein VCG02_04745 [Verrucomicrobiota bacterium]